MSFCNGGVAFFLWACVVPLCVPLSVAVCVARMLLVSCFSLILPCFALMLCVLPVEVLHHCVFLCDCVCVARMLLVSCFFLICALSCAVLRVLPVGVLHHCVFLCGCVCCPCVVGILFFSNLCVVLCCVVMCPSCGAYCITVYSSVAVCSSMGVVRVPVPRHPRSLCLCRRGSRPREEARRRQVTRLLVLIDSLPPCPARRPPLDPLLLLVAPRRAATVTLFIIGYRLKIMPRGGEGQDVTPATFSTRVVQVSLARW